MDENTRPRGIVTVMKAILHRLAVVAGAAALTLAFFLVLPLMQTLAQRPVDDMVVRAVETAEPPPPPPEVEEEEEEEEKPEEKPPELVEEAPPLDLQQLELALNQGSGGDFSGGDFLARLTTVTPVDKNEIDDLITLTDLDQKPRAIHQPGPTITAAMRKKSPGVVHVLFIVDERGRVERATIVSASDPVFEGPALAAVKQWRFEPVKRNGKAVRFRTRVPITFPKAN